MGGQQPPGHKGAVANMIKDLSYWLEKHDRQLDSFGECEVLEACNSATYEQNKKEKFEEWFEDTREPRSYSDREIQKLRESNQFEDWFNESRIPDDYYPIWNTLWEFPSSYEPEELNEKDINGLVFFSVNGVTYAGLTTCGMDMSPSLELAYFLYSDLDISKEHITDRTLRQPDYFRYVVGGKDMELLQGKLGVSNKQLQKAQEKVEQDLKDFDDRLDKIRKLRDSGKISQAEAGLLGMMTYFKSEVGK